MAIYLSDIPFSVLDFWPSGGQGSVIDYLSSTTSTYWIQLNSGIYLRYIGSGFSYNAGAPTAGIYTSIEVTDSAGNVLASLSGIGNAAASDIFNNPAALVLSGDDDFYANGGVESLYGLTGSDDFFFESGDFNSGDIVDGGAGFGTDTIVLHGSDSPGIQTFDVNGISVSDIERLRFGTESNTGLAVFELLMNWSNLAGWGTGLEIEARNYAFTSDRLVFNANGATILNLSGLTFSVSWNADGYDVISINGNVGGGDFVTGSSQNDLFWGSGADQFVGGNGDDAWIVSSTLEAGSIFDGGGSLNDQLVVWTTAHLDNIVLTGVERLNLEENDATATASATYMNALLSAVPYFTILGSIGGIESLSVTMGSVTYLNLSGLDFLNWGTEDFVRMTGDSDAETMTGTAQNDVIISGGGLDTIDASGGDDRIVLEAGSVSSNMIVTSVNGGIGTDTLQINFSGANRYASFYNLPSGAVQSIERLEIVSTQGISGPNVSFLFGQVGSGISSNLVVSGPVGAIAQMRFHAAFGVGSNLDLSGFQFQNWDSYDNIYSYGSGLSDVITGSNQNDQIGGGGGNDSLNGGDGNDIFNYGHADSTGPMGSVNGGTGADMLSAYYAYQTMDFRNLGITSVESFVLFDQVSGPANLTAIFNASQMVNNFGTIVKSNFYNATATVQIEMAGETTLDLSNVIFSNWTTNDSILILGDADGETITGSSARDTITGNGGDDIIEGGDGADILNGGDDFDTLSYQLSNAGVTVNLTNNQVSGGHASGDTISNFESVNGSEHGDVIYANGGNRLYGMGGDDTFIGLGGGNYYNGGGGTDTLDYSAYQYSVWFNASDLAVYLLDANGQSAGANDALGIERYIGSNTAGDIFDGFGEFIGGGGNDQYYAAFGFGSDIFNGGSGVDSASYAPISSTLNIDLQAGTATGLGIGIDQLIDVENIQSGFANDRLFGSSAANSIDGGGGNDQIDGRGGVDTLNGGAGSDWLFGGADADTATGGADADIFAFDGAGTAGDVITDYTAADRLYFGNNSAAAVFSVAGSTVTVNGVQLTNGTAGNVIAITQAGGALLSDVGTQAGILAGTSSGLGGVAYILTEFDANSNETYRTASGYYTASNQLDFSWIFMDAGQAYHSRYTDYDQGGAGTWARIESTYITAGVLDYQWTYYDVPGTVHSMYNEVDQANSGNWNNIQTFYSAIGVIDYQWTYYDAGYPVHSAFINYDQSNSNNWTTINQYYTGAGVIDYQWTYYDAGQPQVSQFIDYDQANANIWSSIQTAYSATNVVDFRWTYYDAGQPKYADFIDYDQANAATWSSQAITYSALNVIDYRWTYYDAGQPQHSEFIDFDQANAGTWSSQQIAYSAPSVIDYRWTYYDAGQPLHAQFIDYDQANAYSWSQHIINYSAPGVVSADYYV